MAKNVLEVLIFIETLLPAPSGPLRSRKVNPDLDRMISYMRPARPYFKRTAFGFGARLAPEPAGLKPKPLRLRSKKLNPTPLSWTLTLNPKP